MKIEFKRSGGMGPMTNVSAAANVSDTGGDLRSDDGKVTRTLTSEEANRLRTAASSSVSRDAAADSGETPQLLDGFQYDITVTSGDGSSKRFKINAGNKAELNKLSPGMARLLAWVEEASEKILEERLKTP